MSTSPIKTYTTEQGADHLERAHTTGSISMSPELFEQLYLAPHSRVKGDLRQKLGNPTPLALGGFLLCTTPASMALLGWRGSGGFGAGANVGAYFWFGGLLMLLGSIGEWILGNTFPSVLFGLFGGFWFTFGSTIVPDYNAYGLYSKTGVVADGLKEGEFYSTFSFFLISMGILCAVFAVASIRTNVVLFTILVILVPCFGCLSASFFAAATGETAKSLTYQHAGAAILFVVSMLGWYIFLSHILLSVDFPYTLPLGDLSSRIPGATKVKKDNHSEEEKV
ncbi:GPR1-like protein [Fusarium denticulatum]|uniref:GPR1-like protein n=1 Tax=Fusarium denticulatum TaxID=48507 RepID=A0A8H5XKN9_9HYPO|nr:GPR1-like protein [Fusarium denticulatum]